MAGVHVTNAGVTGGSARIVIRGASSITGNNQPLFIVDGIPVDNSSPTHRRLRRHGLRQHAPGPGPEQHRVDQRAEGPERRGPVRHARGERRDRDHDEVGQAGLAANLGITATSSLTFESPLKLPNYQNGYGQGLYGEFQYVDGSAAVRTTTWTRAGVRRLNGQLIDQFTGAQMPFLPTPTTCATTSRRARRGTRTSPSRARPRTPTSVCRSPTPRSEHGSGLLDRPEVAWR